MKIPKGLELYFDPVTAKLLAERQENYRHREVAEIIATIILDKLKDTPDPISVAALGAGAHADRYNSLFDRLLRQSEGHMDWVDFSPYMLAMAPDYLQKKGLENREKVISYIEQYSLQYLEQKAENSLDAVIMQYTLEDIQELELLFKLLAKAVKEGGIMVATIQASPEITSVHSNWRYLYQGKEFQENETRTLKDGEEWQLKCYKEVDNPAAGFIPGVETVKYFHSSETIAKLANKYGFDCFIGDWREPLPGELQNKFEIDQSVLILKKK